MVPWASLCGLLIFVHSVTGRNVVNARAKKYNFVNELQDWSPLWKNRRAYLPEMGWDGRRQLEGWDEPDVTETSSSDFFLDELQNWSPRKEHRLASLMINKRTRLRLESVTATGCGVSAIPPNVNTRVVGGIEAVPHSWPWMVSLQVNGEHWCGGNLIDNQWVLSAAHCNPLPHGFSLNGIEIVVGSHRHSQPDSYTIRVPVNQLFPHHKYGRQTPYTSPLGMTSDLMLIKLEHPVTFNDAVSPICLPEQLFQKFPVGKRCFSSGWGSLSTEGEAPDELMQVMLPLLDNDVCNQQGWHDSNMDDSMVCAGYAEGELGNCYGDSGGPLVCYDEGHWVLYGVVSWGSLRGCAASEGPTVYGRVSAYLGWISEITSAN